MPRFCFHRVLGARHLDAGVVQGALRNKQSTSFWKPLDRNDVRDPSASSMYALAHKGSVVHVRLTPGHRRSCFHTIIVALARIQHAALAWLGCVAAYGPNGGCRPAGVREQSPTAAAWAQLSQRAVRADWRDSGRATPVLVTGTDPDAVRAVAAALGEAGADAGAVPPCQSHELPWLWYVFWRAPSDRQRSPGLNAIPDPHRTVAFAASRSSTTTPRGAASTQTRPWHRRRSTAGPRPAAWRPSASRRAQRCARRCRVFYGRIPRCTRSSS